MTGEMQIATTDLTEFDQAVNFPTAAFAVDPIMENLFHAGPSQQMQLDQIFSLLDPGIDISNATENGLWRGPSVVLEDVDGNASSYDEAQLVELGHNTFKVVNAAQVRQKRHGLPHVPGQPDHPDHRVTPVCRSDAPRRQDSSRDAFVTALQSRGGTLTQWLVAPFRPRTQAVAPVLSSLATCDASSLHPTLSGAQCPSISTY